MGRLKADKKAKTKKASTAAKVTAPDPPRSFAPAPSATVSQQSADQTDSDDASMLSDDDFTSAAVEAAECDPEDTEARTCRQCNEVYTRAENTRSACYEWDAGRHKGDFEVNWESTFWETHGEHEGPPESDYCKEEYGRSGGYRWSGCGCVTGPEEEDECLRMHGFHRCEDIRRKKKEL